MEADGGCVEDEARLPAVDMREARLAEVPQQHAYLIVACREEGGEVHYIVVGIARIGSPLEPALEDSQRVVDPKPVLGVGCDMGQRLLRTLGQGKSLAELYPCVGRVAQGVVGGDPVCGVRRQALSHGYGIDNGCPRDEQKDADASHSNSI